MFATGYLEMNLKYNNTVLEMMINNKQTTHGTNRSEVNGIICYYLL